MADKRPDWTERTTFHPVNTSRRDVLLFEGLFSLYKKKIKHNENEVMEQ